MNHIDDNVASHRKSANRSFARLVGGFCKADRGNVAIIFGLCVLPLLLAGGVAIDLSRALIVRERLGHTLDAAALSVGSKPGLTQAERNALADEFFKANYPDYELGTPGNITVNADNQKVTASATATVPTTILGMFGYSEISVGVDVEVIRQMTGLEVVMVLDNTGSMAGSKIAALRSAATTLVNTLFSNAQPGLLKIGLVPFANAVNLGAGAVANGWIDSTAASSIAGENFNSPPVANVLTLYGLIPNRPWNGCVEERKPPYDLSDAAPTVGTPDTLWLPYFAPDEPSNDSNYPNSYLPDVTSGTASVRQRYVPKYNGTNASSGKGPLEGCTVTAITPLTDDQSALLSAISAMGADGNTHIPLGIAWGRRVLSSGQPYTQGVAYDDPEWKKAAIILTDGENTIDSNSTHNKSAYSAYGYLAKGRLGTTSASTFVTRLNEKTAQICQEMKDDNIEIYTIAFNVTSPTVTTLLRNCATSPANYFNSPSGTELQAAFNAIASALSNLRLSK